MTSLQGFCHGCLLALGLSSLPVQGQPSGTPPAASGVALIQADETVQLLRDNVLQVDVHAQRAEDDLFYPKPTRTTVYLGVSLDGIRVSGIGLQFNDRPAEQIAITPEEADALLASGGLQRILQINLQPDDYRLRIRVEGQQADTETSDPFVAELEAPFSKGRRHSNVVIELTSLGTPGHLPLRSQRGSITATDRVEGQASQNRSRVGMVPIELGTRATPTLVVDTHEVNDIDEVRTRTALAFAAREQYLSAAVELLSIAPGIDLETLHEPYQWQLAKVLLAAAQRDAAQAIYHRLEKTSTDAGRYARSQLRVAEYDLRHGQLATADKVLMALQKRLPEDLLHEWQFTLSRVLLAQGRYGEASEHLRQLVEGGFRLPYTRYNLGVTLAKAGDTQGASDLLDQVGRMPIRTDEDQAIRDKANLTLGWHALQDRKGGLAKAAFQRVHVQSRFANRALLGLGWAALTPSGAEKRPLSGERVLALLGTLGALLRPGNGETTYSPQLRSPPGNAVGEHDAAALRQALVAWAELIGRNTFDPSVQEGWLAIPWSFDRLGAHTQALEYYELAISALEQNRMHMHNALAALETGHMIDAMVRDDLQVESGDSWQPRDPPDLPEAYYLQTLLAEHRFQEALKDYRALKLFEQRLESWSARLIGLQQQHRNVPRPSIAPDELFANAMAAAGATRHDVSTKHPAITLRHEDSLAPPGRYSHVDDGLLRLPGEPLRLKASFIPDRFDGPYENAEWLRHEIRRINPQLAFSSAQQARLLTRMATDELQTQLEMVEKYLIEAHFAMARLHDRSL